MSQSSDRSEIIQVMRRHIEEDREPYLDNSTALAEHAAHDLDHDEWLDDPHHEVWEIAILMGEEHNLLS